jgi:hypothetical protein
MSFFKDYWRILFRKGTWSEAALSLGRVHKDKRARRHLFSLALLLLLPVLLAGYLVVLTGTGSIYFIPFVIPVLWLIRRGHRKQDETSLSITAPSEPIQRELNANETAEIRSHFAEKALVFAVFVERSLSETFLKQNKIPEGHEIISRRAHLELLKSRGLWDKMPQTDRDAMIDADGNWEPDLIHRAVLCIEPLRVLRWVLRLDFVLPHVGRQLHVDHKVARELIEEPDRVLRGTALATMPMLETGRDAANHFVIRCAAELISRGHANAATEEIRQWAVDAVAMIGGDQSEDLLLDGKLVSESSEAQIRWAWALARKRADFLNWAIHVMEGSVRVEPQYAPIV